MVQELQANVHAFDFVAPESPVPPEGRKLGPEPRLQVQVDS
jgi:hypothetical protein